MTNFPLDVTVTGGDALTFTLSIEPEEDYDGPMPCSMCGEIGTIELTDDGPHEQSITVCATCGWDGG